VLRSLIKIDVTSHQYQYSRSYLIILCIQDDSHNMRLATAVRAMEYNGNNTGMEVHGSEEVVISVL